VSGELPPVVQEFGVNGAAYLDGVDAMAAASDRLAESIDAVLAGADRMSAALDAAAGADDRLTAAQDALAAQVERVVASLDGLAGAADEASASAAAGFGRASVAADALRVQVGDSAAAAKAAAGSFGEAAGAADAFAAAAGRAGGAADVEAASARRGGAAAAGMGGAMKTALLGTAIALGYGIDKAAGFQSSIEQLHTQAGISQSKLAGLSQGVLKLAGQVGEGPDSLSESLYHVASNLASTGASGTQMLNAVKVAAEGAQVGNANLVDVTNALGAAIASGIPGVQNYSQAMGYMNATVGAGDMKMQDLADAFGTGVLANIKMYGVTLQDVSAALATYGDNNIRGAKAGTDLRMAVQALVAPVSTAAPALKSLGLNTKSFADEMKTGGLNGALQLLVSRMKSAGVTAKDQGELITELFGKKAGAGIGVLVGEFDRFQGKYAQVKKGADDFAGDWAARQKTMSQQWDNLKSSVQALAISFGSVLLPAATKIVGALAKVGQFLEAHPAIAAFAGAILAVAVAFKIAATAEALFNAVSDANPVTLAVIAVIALAAGLYLLYTHCRTVRVALADIGAFFAGTWHAAVRAAGAVTQWFVTGPLAFVKQQLAVFAQFWAAHGAQVEQVAKGVWNTIAAIVTTAWHVIYDGAIRPGLATLEEIWRVAWGVISDAVKFAWNTIAAIIRASIRICVDVISLALDLITGKWGAAWADLRKLGSDALNGFINVLRTFASGAIHLLWDAGVNIVRGLIQGIESMAGAVMGVVSSLAHGAVSAFKSALSIFSPSRVFYSLGSMITTGLANGISETASQAEAAANTLAAKVNAAYARGQITAVQQTQLIDQIGQHLASRSDTLGKTMQKLGLEMGRQLISSIANASSASTAKTAVDKLNTYILQAWSAGDVSFNGASRLLTWVAADNSRIQGLAAKRQSIVATIKAADTYAASVTSSTESWASLSNATSVAGGSSGADIGAGMQMQLAQIKTFATDIKALAKRGLSKALLDQIIQAGPASGLPIAEALMDDSTSQISSLNASESAITSYSTSLGQTAANAMYDSGAQAGKGFLSGLQAQEKAITAQMDKIAASMVATLKKDLKISSPSRVMADTGKDTAAGLVQGLAGGQSGVQAAAHGLAQAITAGVNGGSAAGLRVSAGAAAGSAAAGNTTVQITVNGYIGSEQELATELFTLLQHASLQNNRRNPTNGLALVTV
jgi:TP901 family phage tail tape measure protein